MVVWLWCYEDNDGGVFDSRRLKARTKTTEVTVQDLQYADDAGAEVFSRSSSE